MDIKSVKFEKWLLSLTEEQVEKGFGKRPELEIFDENITCWIELPYDIALELLIRYFNKDYPNPIGELDHSPFYLEIEYHTDDDSFYYGLWIDPNAYMLDKVPENFETFIRQSYKNIINKYKK